MPATAERPVQRARPRQCVHASTEAPNPPSPQGLGSCGRGRGHDGRHGRSGTAITGPDAVQQHAAGFIAHTEASTGAALPRFIKDEFDAFLECGILAHGFLRLRCGECGYDKLLAFSCKRRGFCPSCGARRMSRTAAHLVDHALALPLGRSPGTILSAIRSSAISRVM